jgi:hypothetical protein
MSELSNIADMDDVSIEEGSLCILNISAGDIKVSFNKDVPEEVEHARQIIEDMFKRGYSILVAWGSGWRRATKFIASRDSYIIETREEKEDGKSEVVEKEVPAKKARAVGIAPTAGG